MAEDIGAAVVLHDEPEALRIIEPLHGTSNHLLHFFRVGGGTLPLRAADCGLVSLTATRVICIPNLPAGGKIPWKRHRTSPCSAGGAGPGAQQASARQPCAAGAES